MQVKTSELAGRALNYAVAMSAGYGWAKNMVPRSGDGLSLSKEVRWPVGARCVVTPSSLKHLHPTLSLGGWCTATMDEPVAPAAFYNIPNYLDGQAYAELLWRWRISVGTKFHPPRTEGADGLWVWEASCWNADGKSFWFEASEPIVAVLRCVVAQTYGAYMEIPEELK